jgi:hypothetical protein
MNDPIKVERNDVPKTFRLAQNVPNPFEPLTEIGYDLAEDCHVRLDIYNVFEQRVKTLVDGYMKTGYKTAQWNGKNTKGAPISSGVYFYRLKVGTYSKTKRIVFLK